MMNMNTKRSWLRFVVKLFTPLIQCKINSTIITNGAKDRTCCSNDAGARTSVVRRSGSGPLPFALFEAVYDFLKKANSELVLGGG